MAKRNTQSVESTQPEQAIVVHAKVRETTATAVDKMIAKCLLSAKTMLQSAQQFEKELADTALVCLKHAHDHGDCTKIDKLLKGLPDHPVFRAYRNELVSWVRANSPIAWRADGSVHILKKDEPGYKEYNEEQASDEAFYNRPAAKKARQAAEEAHARTLKPLTFQDILGRIQGLRKTVQAATKEDKNGQVRGIAKGEKKKILDLITKVEEVALPEGEQEKEAA